MLFVSAACEESAGCVCEKDREKVSMLARVWETVCARVRCVIHSEML